MQSYIRLKFSHILNTHTYIYFDEINPFSFMLNLNIYIFLKHTLQFKKGQIFIKKKKKSISNRSLKR